MFIRVCSSVAMSTINHACKRLPSSLRNQGQDTGRWMRPLQWFLEVQQPCAQLEAAGLSQSSKSQCSFASITTQIGH